MQFLSSLLFSCALLSVHQVHASAIDRDAAPALMNLHDRQTQCEKDYGVYPEYTGPCEATNCGASGKNCRKTGWSGCVGYPSFVCPYKGCACTNY